MAIIVVFLTGVSGFAMIRFWPVSEHANGPAAEPSLLRAFDDGSIITSVDEWKQKRPLLRELFQSEVYGYLPGPANVEVVAQKTITSSTEDKEWPPYRIEQVTLKIDMGDYAPLLNLALAIPADAEEPLPVILGSGFCGNQIAFRNQAVDAPLGAYPAQACSIELNAYLSKITNTIFGGYLASPPLDLITDRGYVYASLYPGDIAPDDNEAVMSALTQLSPPQNGADRLGAIGAWAWIYSRVIDYLDADPRFDNSRTALYGHSRMGKSVLVAGAFDDRADLIFAHQSGTGGATLNRSHVGESIEAMTSSYPFWFNKKYAAYAGDEEAMTFDQHMLLAMIAPRPVLLGNGARDRWSDPQGAFQAAMGADPIYELYDRTGLDQETLTQTNLDAELAFFMKSGGHGVSLSDWKTFLNYLDSQFFPEQ